jgi:hypothetical protein
MTSSLKLGLVLAAVALLGHQVASAASHFGYRMDFPDDPLPVGLTNDWAFDNLTSVANTAGGHGAITNLANNQPIFPTNVPAQPYPRLRAGLQTGPQLVWPRGQRRQTGPLSGAADFAAHG